jgi:archaellum biogenesis protein FlaJ (TadC family)
MSQKKTSTVSATIPLWLLVPVVWLNFFWPNTPSLILISLSIFFFVISYIILFFVYAVFLKKNKITFKQIASAKKKKSKYNLALQITSVISFIYTAWAGTYNGTLTSLVVAYVLTNLILIGYDFYSPLQEQ